MASSLRADTSVLVVDDDVHLSRTVADILRLRGFRAQTASNAQGGLELAKEMGRNELAIALVDLRLPDMDGMELVGRLRSLSELTEVVVLTGNASMESVLQALREESFDYLIKPVDPDRLLDTMGRATERWQRRVVEQRLQEAEEKFRLVVENMSDMILLLDAAGAIRYASPSAERKLRPGPGGLMGHAITAVLAPEDAIRIGPMLHNLWQGSSGPLSIEHKYVRGDGTAIHVDSTIQAIVTDRPGYLVSSRDIGDRKELEAELFQSRKMESVGRLAGGIAHDFNNLLTVVMGATELCRLEAGPGFAQRAYLDEVVGAAQRGSAMVRQLLAFSRRQVLVPRVIDLNDLIATARKLLSRVLGEDVELRTVLASEPVCVRADPGQIEQVLMNLTVNARDAMPRGGVLKIGTYVQENREGDRVVIEVSDTGEGIPPEVLEQIFEPFFTTKELGRGTGLGLATVQGIVQQSGGTIHVVSRLGFGTIFTIDLPRVHATPEGTDARHGDVKRAQAGETILLVEDEEPVRMVVSRSLERQGYKVLVATSGTEAAQILRSRAEGINLLLSDVVLPGLTGLELAELGRRIRPGLKVLLASGYSEEAISRRGTLAEIPLLQKPFDPAQLLQAVRAVLDDTSAPGTGGGSPA